MHIWVDADACPRVIKEILFRAVGRVKVPLTLVANQAMAVPPSPHIKAVQVAQGFDVADNHIVQGVSAGDLVITGDIPLAAEVVAKGALVISPRGEKLSANNIRQRLNMRDFMEELRSTGQLSGGPPPLNLSDRMSFANTLDAALAKMHT